MLGVLVWAAWCAVVGAALGSFAVATGERLARGESLMTRSHCQCGRPLKPSENIPVVGWIRTGGIAACCGARLSPLLLLGEIAPAAAAAVTAFTSGPGVAVAVAVAVAAVVAVASFLAARRR